jgi:hypothetical protein
MDEMSETDNLSGDADSERRQFFRIEDTVRLSISPVTAEQMQQGLAELEQGKAGNFTVMSSLAAITAQMSASMRRIEGRDPDLAAYLRALDHKLEILGRGFMAQDSELLSEPAQPVNLSAGGVSLYARDVLPAGQLVEIRLLLFPSFTGLLAYGDVVACEPLAGDHGDYHYQLRIEFSHLRDNDREILIRHVLQRQSEGLRERRRRLDAGEAADD